MTSSRHGYTARLFSSSRDCSPPRHGRDRAAVGTVRARTWKLHASLPAASLWATARAARSALPAPCAGAYQPRATHRLANKAVFRYCHFHGVKDERVHFDSRASAKTAGTAVTALGQDVNIYLARRRRRSIRKSSSSSRSSSSSSNSSSSSSGGGGGGDKK